MGNLQFYLFPLLSINVIILGTNSVYNKQQFGEESVQNELLLYKNHKKLKVKYKYIFVILLNTNYYSRISLN